MKPNFVDKLPIRTFLDIPQTQWVSELLYSFLTYLDITWFASLKNDKRK